MTSDYYVAIVSGKYGTIAPDGLSYSEKEYDYAVQKTIPVIALIRENVDALEVAKRETATDTLEMLERFRRKLNTGRLVSHWKDETELCYRLINSLAMTTKKYPGRGWVRGGKESPEDLLRKIVALEEENRALQKTILDQQQEPLASRIMRLLEGGVNIKYKYTINSDDTIRDDVVPVSGLKIAQFLIPRLKQQALVRSATDDLRWGEEKLFSSLVSKLVVEMTKNHVVSINSTFYGGNYFDAC